MSSMRTVYQQHVLEHYRTSPFRKQLTAADIVTQMYNPSCGDKVALQVMVRDGVITDIGFDGSGCVLSIAAASLLAGFAVGKPLAVVQAFDVETMRQLVMMPVGPVRLKCILLPLEALHKGIEEYLQRTA